MKFGFLCLLSALALGVALWSWEDHTKSRLASECHAYSLHAAHAGSITFCVTDKGFLVIPEMYKP